MHLALIGQQMGQDRPGRATAPKLVTPLELKLPYLQEAIQNSNVIVLVPCPAEPLPEVRVLRRQIHRYIRQPLLPAMLGRYF